MRRPFILILAGAIALAGCEAGAPSPSELVGTPDGSTDGPGPDPAIDAAESPEPAEATALDARDVVEADIDGDGDDEVLVLAGGTHLVIDDVVHELPPEWASAARIDAVVDLDGDGREELVLTMDGNTRQVATLVLLDGAELRTPAFPDGYAMSTGSGITGWSAWGCSGDDLVTVEYERQLDADGQPTGGGAWFRARWTLDDGELRLLDSSSGDGGGEPAPPPPCAR